MTDVYLFKVTISCKQNIIEFLPFLSHLVSVITTQLGKYRKNPPRSWDVFHSIRMSGMGFEATETEERDQEKTNNFYLK